LPLPNVFAASIGTSSNHMPDAPQPDNRRKNDSSIMHYCVFVSEEVLKLSLKGKRG
jgi:hypothetical protein